MPQTSEWNHFLTMGPMIEGVFETVHLLIVYLSYAMLFTQNRSL